jgi:3-hydroxyacyl-CoA dehydrogenase/enoyl-CoA hydratase/3-hydroxybutyryl-CoA epimerase
MDHVTTSTDYTGFRTADLVIEAVFEDVEIKHRVIREAEAAMRDDAIFASNTSSIPIGDLVVASSRPEQFIGMHFFSPVEKMPLLEVIVTPKTAEWVTATVVEVGKQMGKTVIVVRDGAGFYTSRVLGPYIREAAYLLSDGARIEDVDDAAMDLGFPIGPITLLDEVGSTSPPRSSDPAQGLWRSGSRPCPRWSGWSRTSATGRRTSAASTCTTAESGADAGPWTSRSTSCSQK